MRTTESILSIASPNQISNKPARLFVNILQEATKNTAVGDAQSLRNNIIVLIINIIMLRIHAKLDDDVNNKL